MPRTTVASRPLALIALLVGLVLFVTGGRYGYHRDELYFIAAGHHPAFGYVDQPPLIPLLARAMEWLGGGSLLIFRLPSAIAAALIVLLTGLIAQQLGASRRGQTLAASCMAVGSLTYAVGHLMSTSTYDLLVWTLLSYLLVRAVRDDGRGWLAVGLVAGIGLEVKVLVAFFLLGIAVGVLVTGPRQLLRSVWMWSGVATAVALWAPNLIWEAANGWPQIDLANAIANGSSATSEPRWAFVPYQLLLVSPLLFPVWMAGWWELIRSPRLRTWRFFAVAYVVLAVVFIITGGKPYYLGGMYPVLLAAGAEPALRWVAKGAARRVALGVALAGSMAAAAYLFLPLVPTHDLPGSPILAVNSDAGETVGWPGFADTVADVVDANSRGGVRPVVLTGNYGEAGAMLRYGPDAAAVFSVHNSFWTWGPPPETPSVVAIGFSKHQLERWFADVRPAATIDNGLGLDNDEQGERVWLCTAQREPWAKLWPTMRHLG